MKYCPGCTQTLPLDQFATDNRSKSGKQGYCRQCQKLRRKPRTEEQRQKFLKQYHDNPELYRARNRAQYKKHKQKRLEKNQRYAERYPERVRATNRLWRLNHPEKIKEYHKTRADRLRANGGKCGLVEWLTKCAVYKNACAYCGSTCRLTIHHIIPVSKGGPSSIDNLVQACQSCNSRIHDRIVQPPPPPSSPESD